MLKNNSVLLRALEPADLDLLYKWENDAENWMVSQTLAPYSKFVLEQYIMNSHQDIFSVKQLRLVICSGDSSPVGCIDLFDFDPSNLRAGIGILIADKSNRQKGFAIESLSLIEKYAKETLQLHQLYCNISSDNSASIALFTKAGYSFSGAKKDWLRRNGGWVDEHIYQKIL